MKIFNIVLKMEKEKQREALKEYIKTQQLNQQQQQQQRYNNEMQSNQFSGNSSISQPPTSSSSSSSATLSYNAPYQPCYGSNALVCLTRIN